MQDLSQLEPQTIIVDVDLEKVMHYHQASSVYRVLAERTGTTKSFNTEIAFVYRTTEIDGNRSFHPGYEYFNLPESILPEQDSYNLMFLVQSLISLEWSYYADHVLKLNNVEENMWTVACLEMESLLHLLELRDIKKLQKGKLSLSFTSTFSKRPIHITNDNKLFGMIIEELISDRFKELKNTVNPLLQSFIKSTSKPTYSHLNEVYKSLKIDFEHWRAFTLFRAFVVRKILEYLNAETSTVTPEGETVTADQVKIIYPLLCFFRLIPDYLIAQHRTPHQRRSFTRSILGNTQKNAPHSLSEKKQPNFLQIIVQKDY